MFELFVVGIISGIISPLVFSLLQYKYIWRTRKAVEMKWRAYDDVIKALSLYGADLSIINIQKGNGSARIRVATENIRTETYEAIHQARGQIRALFPPEICKQFEKVFQPEYSSLQEFYNLQSEFLSSLVEYLGVR